MRAAHRADPLVAWWRPRADVSGRTTISVIGGRTRRSMTQPDTADPDAAHGGLTPRQRRLIRPTMGSPSQITAEFTSRRRTRGEAEHSTGSPLAVGVVRGYGSDIYGLDRRRGRSRLRMTALLIAAIARRDQLPVRPRATRDAGRQSTRMSTGDKSSSRARAWALSGHWVKWLLLSIVTFGVYLFWVERRVQRWMWEHTELDVPGTGRTPAGSMGAAGRQRSACADRARSVSLRSPTLRDRGGAQRVIERIP